LPSTKSNLYEKDIRTLQELQPRVQIPAQVHFCELIWLENCGREEAGGVAVAHFFHPLKR
jgi:hypothetical protein